MIQCEYCKTEFNVYPTGAMTCTQCGGKLSSDGENYWDGYETARRHSPYKLMVCSTFSIDPFYTKKMKGE